MFNIDFANIFWGGVIALSCAPVAVVVLLPEDAACVKAHWEVGVRWVNYLLPFHFPRCGVTDGVQETVCNKVFSQRHHAVHYCSLPSLLSPVIRCCCCGILCWEIESLYGFWIVGLRVWVQGKRTLPLMSPPIISPWRGSRVVLRCTFHSSSCRILTSRGGSPTHISVNSATAESTSSYPLAGWGHCFVSIHQWSPRFKQWFLFKCLWRHSGNEDVCSQWSLGDVSSMWFIIPSYIFIFSKEQPKESFGSRPKNTNVSFTSGALNARNIKSQFKRIDFF